MNTFLHKTWSRIKIHGNCVFGDPIEIISYLSNVQNDLVQIVLLSKTVTKTYALDIFFMIRVEV